MSIKTYFDQRNYAKKCVKNGDVHSLRTFFMSTHVKPAVKVVVLAEAGAINPAMVAQTGCGEMLERMFAEELRKERDRHVGY